MNNSPKNEMRDTSHEQRFVADAICPVCFRAIESPTIMQQQTVNGLETRQYFGYCRECRAGFVVIQFRREDRWVIHKYRPAVVLGAENIIEIGSSWKLQADLSKQPDERQKEPDGNNEGLMDSLNYMRLTLKSCCQTIECLINSMLEERNGRK